MAISNQYTSLGFRAPASNTAGDTKRLAVSSGGSAVAPLSDRLTDFVYTHLGQQAAPPPSKPRVLPNLAGFRLLPPPTNSAGPKTPETPVPVINQNRMARYKTVPLIQNALETRALVLEKLQEKRERGEIVPFNLEVAAGNIKRIIDVEPMVTQGDFSSVYRCEVQGEGPYVLKIFKEKYLDDRPHQVIAMVAAQLFRYVENRYHPFLNEHIVRHENFEPHLPWGLDNVEVPSPQRAAVFGNYVRSNMKQGFIFSPYIPTEFPETVNPESDLLKQAVDIVRQSRNARILNDPLRRNMRVDESGKKVVLIDLREQDIEESDLTSFIPQIAKSFGVDPSVFE